MILQALYDYYQRRQSDPDPSRHLPDFGLEAKEISFILELEPNGRVAHVSDVRQPGGRKLIGRTYRVPASVKRTSGIAANLLWDTAEYALGLPDPKKLDAEQAKGKGDDYLRRLDDLRQAFLDRIEALPEVALADEGVQAVLAFLRAPQPMADALRPFDAWPELSASNPNLSFRLVTEQVLVCQRPAVLANLQPEPEAVPDTSDVTTDAPGMCLLTGQVGPIERLHTAVKGVWGAQTSGAHIVSFNRDAFNSFGKTQGANAPVSPQAVFAYTTALNALLARDSRQRLQVGDASTVFWAKHPDPVEEEVIDWIGSAERADPDAHTAQVRALYQSIHDGTFGGARGENLFHVLGLAPNAARLSVRFWHAAPLKVIAERIAAWFDDLSIVRGPFDPEYPALYHVLAAAALQHKLDNLPPSLGGDVMRAILTDVAFPALWLNALVQRCRAEQQVSYYRAAALKACLNRLDRLASPSGASSPSLSPSDHSPRGVLMPMLDRRSSSVAYRLGRLFATLEKIQEEAHRGRQLNATIRDRYYGAASSTPATVFATLLRLNHHHRSKLTSPERGVYFDRLLAEIFGGTDDAASAISGFPSHLNLQDQGRFAVGYYHQRQDFFTRREAAGKDDQTATADSAAA